MANETNAGAADDKRQSLIAAIDVILESITENEDLAKVLYFAMRLDSRTELIDKLTTGNKIIGVDFDSTIHDYNNVWKGDHIITGNPYDGAIAWLTELVNTRGFVVAIVSARCADPRFAEKFRAWCVFHGMEKEVARKIYVPTSKPPLHVMIDDRAYCYNGGPYPEPSELFNFKGWNE